jgi:HicB-like protein involved in pilus formation
VDLDRYVIALRSQLASVAEAGGDEARQLAERLSVTLDAAVRLVLLEALSDAVGEITRQLAPGSVDVVLRGRDPAFVLSRPATPEFAEAAAPAAAAEPPPPVDDTVTSRTTLRLPDQLKARVDRAAAEEGLSVNAWLVRAVAIALEPKRRRGAQRDLRPGDSFTGWVR